MEKKFVSFSYDLSQNSLERGIHFKSLLRTCLITVSGYKLIQSYIYILLRDIDFEKEDILSNIPQDFIDNIVSNVFREIREYFRAELKFYFPYAFSTIRFVVLQVIWFIKTAKIYLLNDKYLFTNNIVFTEEGTVNPKETITQMLENVSLPLYRKFKLAAQFYLGRETVQKYYEQLSEQEKNSFLSLKEFEIDAGYFEIELSCYFWIWKIKRSPDFAPKFITYNSDKNNQNVINKNYIEGKEKIIEIIFRKEVEHHNEIAVHYLWSNYISTMSVREIILEECILKYMTKSTHLNIIIYLFLKANTCELIKLFDRKGHKILALFFNNQRFKKIFFEVLETFKYDMNNYKYFQLLCEITSMYWNKYSSEIDFEVLKKIFSKIPNPNESLLKDTDESRKVYFQLLRVPFERANIELVKYFLHPCWKSLLYSFLSSNFGLQLLEIPIKNSEYEFIQKVFDLKFDSKCDTALIKTIKEKIFFQKSFGVCFDLVSDSNKYILKVNTYFSWLKDGVWLFWLKRFRKAFLAMENWKILKNMIFYLHEDVSETIRYIENILIWCDGYITIDLIRSNLLLHIEESTGISYNQIACYHNVRECVFYSRWKFLMDLMNWNNCTFDEKNELGKKLLNDEYFLKWIEEKDINYIYEYCNFLNSGFEIRKNDEDLKTFKLHVFKKSKLFYSLVLRWKLNEIKKFIEWCEPPPKDIEEFQLSMYSKFENKSYKTEEMLMKFSAFNIWLMLRTV